MGPVRMWPQATARPASLGKEEWIVRTFFFCRYLRCTCRLRSAGVLGAGAGHGRAAAARSRAAIGSGRGGRRSGEFDGWRLTADPALAAAVRPAAATDAADAAGAATAGSAGEWVWTRRPWFTGVAAAGARPPVPSMRRQQVPMRSGRGGDGALPALPSAAAGWPNAGKSGRTSLVPTAVHAAAPSTIRFTRRSCLCWQ